MTAYFYKILEKIESKTAVIGIIGVGYVGLNLGKLISKSGYKTIGFDIDPKKIAKIKHLKIPDFTATDRFERLKDCDIISINVPTPINKSHHPDLKLFNKAKNIVASYLRPGQLIILESTIAPGTTRKKLLPALEKSSLIAEKDFFVAFSSQRIDPANIKYTMKNIPKVLAGLTNQSLRLMKKFYGKIVDKTIPVSSLEIAEFSKIIENTFRFVNINLINELSEYAIKNNIDIWETIDVAATKPFGYLPFYPSVGISGHCIPVDPYYLLDDAKKSDVALEILEKSMVFHKKRISRVISKIFKILKKTSKPKYKILIIGITVKPQMDDIRQSVALKIWEKAEKRGAIVSYHDPYIPKVNGSISTALTTKNLTQQDLIIIITNHKQIDYKKLLKINKPILDTKNVYLEKKDTVYKI